VAASNQRKRNWIRRIFDKSVEAHISFLDQIKAERNAAVDANIAGEIASFSGNGISTVFSASGMSSSAAEDLIGEIEDLYAKALVDLSGRSTPITSPTDEQTLEAMLALTPRRVRSVHNDLSYLRP
jgi:hypothetical protein